MRDRKAGQVRFFQGSPREMRPVPHLSGFLRPARLFSTGVPKEPGIKQALLATSARR